jgi:hypothetical protein
LMYIRYADDWIVAINGSYNEAADILNKIKLYCLSRGLTVSDEKTKITNAYKDKILFLGTYIRHSLVYSYSRHSKGVLQRNRKSLLLFAPMDRIKDKFTKSGFISNNRSQTRVTWVPLTAHQIVSLGNQVLRGYLNYYSFVYNRGILVSWIYWTIKDVVVRTLARKFSLRTRAQVYKKFGKDITVVNYEKRDKDNKPTITVKLDRPSYRMNVWDFKGTSNTTIPFLYSNNISLATLEGLNCTVCKSQYKVEMHHVRMMRDLKPKTDRLEYLMIKANRKQIPLCRSCHIKHHNGDLIIPKFLINESDDDK